MTGRKLIIIVMLTIIFCFPLFAQVTAPQVKESELKSYWMDGTPLLWEKDLAVSKYLKENPDVIEKYKLSKTSSWDFTVGSTKEWYSIDISNNQQPYKVQSTCRAVGQNCYIFVEDSVWGTRVSQASMDSVRIAFDSKTPANPNKGIYQTDVDAFGNPPDIDNDPKIIILLLNIKDGWNGRDVQGFVGGYFFSGNEVPTYPNSNQAEIFFIDVYPQNLNTSSGLQGGMSTFAHEFQHMIHWNYHKNIPAQISFINEGCSLIAEVNCGYPIYSQSGQYGYINETNHYLLDFRPVNDISNLKDYSRAARFHTYLRDQFGMAAFKNLVQTTLYGIDAYNYMFQAAGSTLQLESVFLNWTIANILDDKTTNPAYGYTYQGLPKPTGTINYNPNVPLVTDDQKTVDRLSSDYITYKNGRNLKITFLNNNPYLTIKAFEKGASSTRIVDISPNVEFSEPGYGTTYSEITFLLVNNDRTTSRTYNYFSTGLTNAIELKWDLSEPIGVLPGVDQDTVCVLFNGILGGRLDSIRVGLRGIGSMLGGVWSYSGNALPSSPLGKRLAGPFRANNSVSERPGVPYPVPWPNWGSVDLRKLNIDATYTFAVAFIDSAAYTASPYPQRVMVTTTPGTSFQYSCTSYIDPTTDAFRWLYYGTTNSTYQYLIRAYVSFPQTGVKETIELQPKTITLNQNYPNPFNPSTVINYYLPVNSFVTLKIYDILGKEVATLVSDIKQSGVHNVTWNASSMPSGIYYYRLQAGNINETKKLMLIK